MKDENNDPKPLKLEEEEIKKELDFKEPADIDLTASKLDKKADEYLDKLLDDNVDSNTKREAVDQMGSKTQTEVTNLSKMLDAPIKQLAKSGEGGQVADSLVDLKNQVEALDPMRFDLNSPAGFFERLSKYIPFIGNRLSRYFARYMSAEEVIDRIISSLELGREQLKRDNITLSNDKERMKGAMNQLMATIELGKVLDQKLQYKLDRDINPEDEKYAFIQNELMFPLRQRITDLQQTLIVNQQGILTIEVIIRNNRELIRGVDRALNVTVSALQIAIACALALNNQEVVLKKIKALNDTTNKLIADNAKRLKKQGADIHQKASEAMLDIKTLEQAFADIKSALEEISTYRKEALPKMADNIQRLDKLNAEAFDAVEKLEKGDQASGMTIDLDEADFEILD
jgi:uncharacterized protein YaaN involved in tellurite resistance